MGCTTSDGGGGSYVQRVVFNPASREELRILTALYETIRFDLNLSAELILNELQVSRGPRLYLNGDNLVANLSSTEGYELFPLHDPDCIKKAITYVAIQMYRENELAAIYNSS